MSISRLPSFFDATFFPPLSFKTTHTLSLMNRHETTFCPSIPRLLRCTWGTDLFSCTVSHASYLLMRRTVNNKVPPDTNRAMLLGGAVVVVLGEVYLKQGHKRDQYHRLHSIHGFIIFILCNILITVYREV